MCSPSHLSMFPFLFRLWSKEWTRIFLNRRVFCLWSKWDFHCEVSVLFYFILFFSSLSGWYLLRENLAGKSADILPEVTSRNTRPSQDVAVTTIFGWKRHSASEDGNLVGLGGATGNKSSMLISYTDLGCWRMRWSADYITVSVHSFNVVKVKEVCFSAVLDRKLKILCMPATSAMIDFCYGINLSRVAVSGLLPWIISPVKLEDTVPEKRAKLSLAICLNQSFVKCLLLLLWIGR